MFERIKNKFLQESQLRALREANQDKKIVFCTGCYDILQSGHAVYFNQCKEFGDLLVVGVGRDKTIEKLKGKGRPVNPENNRAYLIAALHDVDYAVLNNTEIGEGKIDFKGVMEHLQPDVFVLNDDDSSIQPKSDLCQSLGIELKLVSRVVPEELVPTSTTNIINKINFCLKAPLRIDFAGGWTDIPFIMNGKKGYVSNVAISPLIEMRAGQFNFSGYPRGSGLSTSTAAKVLEMINAKTYNSEGKTLQHIAEDLFNLENQELNWFIGRQDQYSIVYGGYNCFECSDHYAEPVGPAISRETLDRFHKTLLLLHTGVSRNAQSAVEGVYANYTSPAGRQALDNMVEYGKAFTEALAVEDFRRCAQIMDANWQAQKQLTASSTNEQLDEMYAFAMENGAWGGKICGAGGGGAFVFGTDNPEALRLAMKKRFVSCFEIDFAFEFRSVKELNSL